MFSPLARIDINLDDLLYNLRRIRSHTRSDTPLMAVVKDCAYGCGARQVARTLEEAGVEFFAVARMNEACDLRDAGIGSPILCLGDCSPEELGYAAQNNVRVAVNDITFLDRLTRMRLKQPVIIHVNMDTGMGRLGITPDQLFDAVELLRKNNASVRLEGIYTHFACADEPDTVSVDKQMKLFDEALITFRSAGISPDYVHSPNSAAILRFGVPQKHLIRPGIALYGCKPDPGQDFGIDLRPIATLKSYVVKLKRVSKGTPISYGAHYHAARETTIATVAMGYAHGLPRLLSNKGSVLIGGKRYPIAGNVTMDYIMVDTGEDSISVGDEVVAWGTQLGATISPDEVARVCSTIGYEVLCGMSTGIERQYKRNQIIEETVSPHLF